MEETPDNVKDWVGEDENVSTLRATARHTTKEQIASWKNWIEWIAATRRKNPHA
jgi:hypothetical protein